MHVGRKIDISATQAESQPSKHAYYIIHDVQSNNIYSKLVQ